MSRNGYKTLEIDIYRVNMTKINLKCGCSITEKGEFKVGKGCTERNCGECRTISQLHPFGKKRFTDILFH